MFSNSLDSVLKQVIQQPEWKKYREHCQIMEYWQQVIDEKTQKNTRPLYIEREILYVAVFSAVWGQELTLQRYSLIKKLNFRLDFTIKNIRFSPASWKNNTKQKTAITEIPLQEINFKKLQAEKKNKEIIKTDINCDVNFTIKKWLENIKKSSQNLETCPQCKSLTPQAELTRWQRCRYCIAQKWNDEYRPPDNKG